MKEKINPIRQAVDQPTTVRLPSWMTWDRFGCNSKEFYQTHVQGKDLPVLEEHPLLIILEINGEPWNVFRTDLMKNKQQAENQDYAWMRND